VPCKQTLGHWAAAQDARILRRDPSLDESLWSITTTVLVGDHRIHPPID